MPWTRWTALPKYDPSSYSVSPSRYPGRLSWYTRRPRATAVTAAMTMFTGSRQRGRDGEPPTGASAPDFTVVPLNALPCPSVIGRRQYPRWEEGRDTDRRWAVG